MNHTPTHWTVESAHINDAYRRIHGTDPAHDELVAALRVVLDQVDYTAGACSVTDMVGACLSTQVIDAARAALAKVQA